MSANEMIPANGGEHGEIAKYLEKNAPEVLKSLPKDQRKKLLSVIESRSVSRHYQGPIPEPEDLARFNEIIPNGADRIMRMAEEQARHRMSLETTVVSGQQRQSANGQWFAFLIALFGISSGVFLAIKGHDWVGYGIAGTTVVSLVYTFITGKRAQQKDISSKGKSLPNPPIDQ